MGRQRSGRQRRQVSSAMAVNSQARLQARPFTHELSGESWPNQKERELEGSTGQGRSLPTGFDLAKIDLTVPRPAAIATAASEATIQPKLMSVKEFKAATYVKWHRRKRIAKIDAILKKIDQSGSDSILLSELMDAIDHWLSVADEESNRRAGVLQLKAQVQTELQLISEQLSADVDLEQPQTRQRSNAFTGTVVGAGKTYKSNFSDFDSKQFRVSGRAPNRRIEEVKRTQREDGTVVYYAMGLVTGFQGKAPMIAPYPEPISLGDWYPQVTHINGMAVAPKSGILSAAALQESVNNALGSQDDVALGQDAVDVLYTYSAQRGGLFSDLADCIKGKVEMRDEATERQEEIMLDAVHRRQRVTVSAHSRGTIKTDNAVRNAHAVLSRELLPEVRAEHGEEAIAYWRANDPGIGLEPELLAEMMLNKMAEKQAKELMNQYIQLIYAGNAVQHPSAILKVDMFVGGLDLVSMFVGTYSETGRMVDAAIGTGGTSDSKLHSVGGTRGHGFVGNYVPKVGKAIANDIRQRDRD
jgi:hypothetical protein